MNVSNLEENAETILEHPLNKKDCLTNIADCRENIMLSKAYRHLQKLKDSEKLYFEYGKVLRIP